MRLFRRIFASFLTGAIFTSLAVAQVPEGINTYATVPELPVIDQPVTIYVNINNWNITDTEAITAYTGTVTTASDSKTGWRNLKGDWGDVSNTLTMENDSIYSLTINDINAYYAVPESEEVVRIAFIARGTSGGNVSGQTSDIFIDVFAEEPVSIFSYVPEAATDRDMIVVTWNINDTETPTRNDLNGYTDTTYIHTWGGEGSAGSFVGPNWGNNDAKWMCETVNDSIRRFYYAPSVRELMDFAENATVESLGILIRNKAANGQTNDFTIDLESDIVVDLSMVDPLLMVPATPTQNEPIYIYIDAKNYMRSNGDKLNPESTLSAWSGLTTDVSSVSKDWQYQVNAEWGGFGDSTLFERVNDTIHRWSIKSLKDVYGVNTAEEDVFRIALIARDTAGGAVSKQTDDLFFEVYGELPLETAFTTQPAVVTENDAFVVTINPELADHDKSLFSLMDTIKADTLGVYAHTGVSQAMYYDDVAEWQNVLEDWAVNTAKNEAVAVTSNIVRFYVLPDAREKYSVADTMSALGVHFVLRNEAGSAQTADLFVPFDTTGLNLGAKPTVGIDQEITDLDGLTVYPNPVDDILYLRFEQAEDAKITFYNAVGQVLHTAYTEREELISIDVGEFARSNSLVFYRVDSGKKVTSGKVLVY